MVKKGSVLLICMIALVAFAIWAPGAAAFPSFSVGGAGVPSCEACHPALANRGPGHNAHATPTNNDCDSCHGAGSRDDPPIDINCTRCHGRTQDGGGDNISLGEGRGLRIHHQSLGAAQCGNCHGDATGPVGAPESTLPSFYPGPNLSAQLDPCDGSEERFPSNTVSLDNDGDGLTDGADSDCAANTPPVADPNGPYNGTVGVAVQFDGSASFDPDGTIVAYDWDFGGGNTGTGVSATHTYTTDGTFNVTLTVTDDGGATDSATTTATIGVGNQPPVANANGPYNGTVGVAVQFDGSASFDPDGTIVAYDWDFGDGNTGNGPTPSHTYAADGTYNVTLTVTDDGAVTGTTTTTATIGQGNQAPVADPNGPYTGTAGVPVNFDGTGSNDPDGTIVAYDWNFGDGNSGTGPTPSHTYATDGTFNVTLTVTDDGGATESAMTTATINPDARVVLKAEVEVEGPGAINGANRSRTPIEIELDEEDDMQFELAALRCDGDVSSAQAMPERINAEDDNENSFTALFRTQELRLVCEDTAIVCTGTLSDGTTFMGEDKIRVTRDFEGNRCAPGDDEDKDDDLRHMNKRRRDKDDDDKDDE